MEWSFIGFLVFFVLAAVVFIVQGIEQIDESLWIIGGVSAVAGCISGLIWYFSPPEYVHKRDRRNYSRLE